ncbi:Nucleolar protein 13 [Rhinocladiella similis]
MSATEVETVLPHEESQSRKRNAEVAEIEIDVDAPEPPSKKALRKAKRVKSTSKNGLEEVEPNSETAPTPVSSSQGPPKRSPYGIWIGNLTFTTTKDDLTKFLTEKSKSLIHQDHITRVHLPQGPPKHGKAMNKGFSYVDFSTEDSLKAALELSEGLLGGRRVLIKNAKDFGGRPDRKKDQDEVQTKAASKRIFVGNLDFDTTVEDLESHFEACGPISHTHMATFEDSGKCKGFAWVEFEQLASAEAAMRGWTETGETSTGSSSGPRPGKHRVWLGKINGRKLRMEFAEDKATRYQKRFGKNAKSSSAAADDGQQEEAIREVDDEPVAAPKSSGEKKANRKRTSGKYAEETVQRLTGAIIESKGQKVVFD